MTLEELKVVISAETKGLEKAVKGVKNTLTGLTKTVSNTTKKITAQFNKMGKSINNSFKSLAKIAGFTAIITGLVKLGKQAIQTASDLAEIQNVVDVAFGESSKEIDAWSKTTLRQFGLVEKEAKYMASNFKAMANSMGIADKSGKAMAVRLTELAGDLASFRNISTEEAYTAVSGIFTGQIRSLHTLGIAMTEANLNAYAMAKGMSKTYQQMSQSEQILLRYQYLLSVTADAQGDFARTSGSWANQMRILQGQWSSFLSTLGTGLKQVLAPVLQALNNILATIITITKNLLTMLGVDFNLTAASVSSAGFGAEDLADGLDDATSSAKALNKEIAGFDELETIGEKNSAGDLADALSDLGSDLDITMPEVATDKTEDSIFGSFREAMENLQKWFETTMDPWLVDKSTKFANWLNGVFGDKDSWAQAGNTVGAGLNGIIHALDAFFTNLDGYNIGSALGTFLNNLTTKVDWSSVGHAWGEKLKTQMDIAIGFLETYDFKNLGESIARMFDNADWSGIGERLGKLISDMLLAAMDFAIGLTSGHWGENASNFINGFAEGWKGDELKQKFLDEFKPAIQEAWDELWSSLESNEYIGGLVKTLEDLAATLKQILDVLIPLAAAIKGFEIVAGIFTTLTTGIPVLSSLADLILKNTQGWSGFVVEANGSVSPLNFIIGTVKALGESILTFGESVKMGGIGPLSKFVAAAGPVIAIIAAIAAALVGAYHSNEQFKEAVDNLAATIKEDIGEIWDKLKEFYNSHLKPLIGNIKEMIKALWNGVLKPFFSWIGELATLLMPVVNTIWKMIKSVIGNIVDLITHLTDILDGLITFLTGVFSGDWEKAWEGIVKTFKSIFEGLKDIVKAVVNVIIGFINSGVLAINAVVNNLIRILNKLKINIPNWVPEIGGKSFGFNISPVEISTIPYLAKGGVLDSPTVAMLGEYQGAKQNPEIAAPESLIRDIIVNANGEMVSAFYQMAQQIITTIENVDMSVQIGDDTIAQAAKRGSDNYYRRTGKPMYAM